MSIKVEHLTKSYGTQLAVNDISFSVERGEIVGFLGPNGAGKSTTMKMLTGYIPPDSGSAVVAGHNINKFDKQGRRKVGYLPESNPLYRQMYVCEYLDFIADLSGIKNRRKRIGELLELTGLSPERNKVINALSKGYKQRVGLAQALLSDPEVLILDEPTSGLDPNQLADIRKLIRSIGKDKTIMLSTHIMQEVTQMCDRVLIINEGVIVADEKVSVLASKSSGIGCNMEVGFEKALSEADLEKIPFQLEEKISDSRYIFSGDSEGEMSKAINRFAYENENAVLHLSTATRDLEAVFRELTASKPDPEPGKQDISDQ